MRKIEIMVDQTNEKLLEILKNYKLKPLNINGKVYACFEGIDFLLLDEANYKQLYFVCNVDRKREGVL